MKEITLEQALPFLENEMEKDATFTLIRSSYLEMLKKDADGYLVVSEEDENGITGVIIVNENTYQIVMVIVKQEIRRHGIGKALLQYVMTYCESLNIARITCNSLKQTIPFFTASGFQSVHETDDDVHVLELLLGKKYLGKTVKVSIDHPYGSHHLRLADETYPFNYGYVLDCLPKDDGEFQDAYVVGVYEPLETFTGVVIGIVYHVNEFRSRFIVAPVTATMHQEEVIQVIGLEEQFYDSQIIWK